MLEIIRVMRLIHKLIFKFAQFRELRKSALSKAIHLKIQQEAVKFNSDETKH